jgi:hypothetical protein
VARDNAVPVDGSHQIAVVSLMIGNHSPINTQRLHSTEMATRMDYKVETWRGGPAPTTPENSRF